MACSHPSDPREPDGPEPEAEDEPREDSAPTDHEQRLSELRARIAAGEYRVDPVEVARGIFRSDHLERPLRLVEPSDDEPDERSGEGASGDGEDEPEDDGG